MKKILIALAIFLSATPLLVKAQKVKIKDKVAYIDDKPYLKTSRCRNMDATCSLYNLQDKEMVFITYLTEPYGRGFLYEKVAFLGLNKYIEFRGGPKEIIKLLYANSAFLENGEFNLERINILVEKYGKFVTGNMK